MSVNIHIEKKDLWLLVAIGIFLVGVGYVIAVNPSSKPNPGHASNEIMININDGDKTLQEAIDGGDFVLGVEGTTCRTLITTDSVQRTSWTPIDIPQNCRDRPCKLVMVVFKNVNGIDKATDIKFGDYFQVEVGNDLNNDLTTERWETSGNMGAKNGNNGDGSETNIFSTNNLEVKDDEKNTEMDKTKWAYRDNSDAYGMTIQVCNY